jgi:hypothetical protein
MKKITIALIFILALNSPALYAQIVVALHTEGDAGQRTVSYYYQSDGFQKAYADASDGDTIYLPGGIFIPPSTIAKKLVIYGAGHYPAATTETGVTFINGDLRLSEGADNLYLEGLHVIGSIVTHTNNLSINHISVVRCFFTAGLTFIGDKTNPSNNISFIGCVFNGTGIYNFQNIKNAAVHNSIIRGRISNSEANLFSNNIFFFTSNNAYIFSSSDNNTIQNNIFLNSSDWYWVSASTGNKWYNNIIPALEPRLGAGDTDVNNFKGTGFASVFINQNGGDFSYEDDYRLAAPGSYAGTDNSQVGIYGGIFPYREAAVPLTPHISNVQISPRSDTEGNIRIDITVRAQEYP